MTEVTNDLMYEVLKQIQDRLIALEGKVDEVKSELHAVRIHSLAMQQDIQNIYSILVRHDARLDRIERRLEIAEAPA
jgi:tetrahydromethanopterin S-methyltransferase subunit G